jgi:hypothetical protein
MKYLKTFENLEDFSSGVSEIEKFIKDNLAYILDRGFTYKINFKFYGNRMNYFVRIHNIEEKDNNRKEVIIDWEDTKDDLIPFLELLNDKYTLESYSPEDKRLVIDIGETYLDMGIYIPEMGLQQTSWLSFHPIEEFIDDTIGDIKFQFISFIITGYK